MSLEAWDTVLPSSSPPRQRETRRGQTNERGFTMTKRRTFSAQFKAMTVLALVSGEKTSGELCRENEIKPQSFYQWRDQLLSDAHLAFEHSAVQESVEGQIAELERKVGRLTMELDVAKKPRRS